MHFCFVLAKRIIESLTEQDKIAVLAISNDWISPQLNEECLMPNQVPPVVSDVPKFTTVDPSKKKLLYKFIDGMYKGRCVQFLQKNVSVCR